MMNRDQFTTALTLLLMSLSNTYDIPCSPDNEVGSIAFAIEPIVSIQSVASVAVHTIELDEDERVVSVE